MATIKRPDLLPRLQGWSDDLRLLLCAGPDESGVREAADLARQTLADADDPMAVTDLQADQLRSDPGLLADEAASVSMFGGRRVIRVQAATEAVANAVEILLQAPVAGNPVIMQAGNLTKASGLRKLVEKSPAALMLMCYPLEGGALMRWLRTEADARGLELTRQVAERLVSAADADTGILKSELDKFALYLDASPDAPAKLDRTAFLALAADSAEENIGLLVSAVVACDRAGLERQLRLLSGSSAIPVLRALARRLVQMADARQAMDAGASASAAVRGLRPPIFPFREQDLVAAALPQWPRSRIEAGLQQMLMAERLIKTPSGPGDRAGWQAILALTGRISDDPVLGDRRRRA